MKFSCVTLIFCLLINLTSSFDFKALLANRDLTPKAVIPEILEYFQQDDPHGLPIIELPEVIDGLGPYDLPYPLSFRIVEAKISGHNGIKLEYVNVNLTSLQLNLRLGMPHLLITGDFEQEGWVSNVEDSYNVSIVNLDINTMLDLGIRHEGGVFQVLDAEVEITSEEFGCDFNNLGGVAYATVSLADSFWSSMIAPMASEKISGVVMDKLNPLLEKRLKDKQFPIDISPIDYLIAKYRRRLDHIDKIPKSKTIDLTSFMALDLDNIDVKGLSTIHRTHEISTQYIDNKIYLTVQIGVQDIEVSSDFKLYSYVVPLKSGHLRIEIESIGITVDAMQDANVKHPPELRKIDIQLGNFGLYSSDNGAIDYILEGAVNLAPNIFRNSIMDIIEKRLHKIIQNRLNRIDVESLIMARVNKM